MSYPYLDKISNPGVFKDWSEEDLILLSIDVRQRINDVVRENGGHLGPNLGAVEIILACHLAFNLDKDRLVFDVGHQAYAHKLLTGRSLDFESLRQEGGMSGYPHPEESAYDVFRSGHASTAISTALGIKEAFSKDTATEDQYSIALVGDGSLTGGMAFEGLNHAGHIGKNLIVILNDNTMSISPTVGGLSKNLNRLRYVDFIANLQKEIPKIIKKIPKFGDNLEELVKVAIEESKHLTSPGQIFTTLGFEYLGPVDGHNIQEMKKALEKAKKQGKPVVVHALTQKGRGYKRNPGGQEEIGPHALAPGQRKKEEALIVPQGNKLTDVKPAPSWSKAFASYLLKLASNNPSVLGLTAAMAEGTGLEQLRKEKPDQYYDVGICEQHATGFAAGLASAGKKPVFAVYSTFLQRAIDQVFHDILLQGDLSVLFCIDRAGVVGDDGPSHHGLYDIAYLRCFPGITLMSPKNEWELQQMMDLGLRLPKSSAIRYPRGKVPVDLYKEENQRLEYGKSERLIQGKNLAIFAYGPSCVASAYSAASQIKDDSGESITVVNARFAKPIDHDMLSELAKEHDYLITMEEGCLPGGIGSAVAEVCCDRGIQFQQICRLGAPDNLVEHASRDQQLNSCGLDSESVVQTVQALLKGENSVPQTA